MEFAITGQLHPPVLKSTYAFCLARAALSASGSEPVCTVRAVPPLLDSDLCNFSRPEAMTLTSRAGNKAKRVLHDYLPLRV